ncbi:hypothetical protein BROUX41_001591 [Berkeleyomyces rouxiae]|uniref:uncharacterized protein n=1 Tax=Berkeleyomyces rouxiae TaxID=2035830 RepID=UPI003B79481A
MAKDSPADSPVLDSWEDGSDTEAAPPSPKPTTAVTDSSASKPAPASSADWHNFGNPYTSASPLTTGSRTTSSSSQRRPEKTDAVARRMIAGALGLKAPKQTEEQRAYHKALLEREKLQRREAREAKQRQEEEAAKARVAVWED